MDLPTDNPISAVSETPQSEFRTPQSNAPGHKRNGKIAKLPKETRDQINRWLDDGRSYPEIIRDLGELGHDLNPGHFTHWYQGGYQDYLRQQQWRDDSRFLLESGSDIPEFANGPQMQQTLIQLALIEIFRALKAGTVQPDSPNYIRLFNALARLNREALGLRKYADATARAETAELKKLDPNRDLVTNELAALVNQMDRAFKMPRPDLDKILAHAAAIGAPDSDRASSPVASGVSPDVEPGIFPGGPAPCFSTSTPSPAAPEPNEGGSPVASVVSPDMPPLSLSSAVSGQTGSVPAVEPVASPARTGSASRSGSPVQSSKFEVQSSTVSSDRDSALRIPNSALAASAPAADTSFEIHKSEIIDHKPEEHCLHCGDPLPALLPDGTRPSPWCACGSPINAAPGFSIRELCPYCSTPVPVHGYNIKRWSNRCGNCDQILPDLDVNAPLRWLPPNSKFQKLALSPSNGLAMSPPVSPP